MRLLKLCLVVVALHFVFLLGLEGNVGVVQVSRLVLVHVVHLQHLALLVVGGDLDVVAGGRLAAAARAHPAEEDAEAVPGLGGEGEVEQRVEQRGREDGPLHDGLVRLVERQEGVQGEEAVVGEDVVEVEELERGSRGFPEEDQEQGDDREPELGGAELAGAAGTDLFRN